MPKDKWLELSIYLKSGNISMCPIEDNFLIIWLNPAETYSYHNVMISSWIVNRCSCPKQGRSGFNFQVAAQWSNGSSLEDLLP